MTSKTPDGSSLVTRPIEPADLDRIVLRCWPDKPTLDRLFAEQGTIGMAAWEGDTCVGLLHCYRVDLPDGMNDDWPTWNNWWTGDLDPIAAGLELTGTAWCHACCHVGRTLDGASKSDKPDRRYFGRGIGTALCKSSALWAREHDYAAVLAPGAPDGVFEFAVWSGSAPWTTYAKLGFEPVDKPSDTEKLPGWAQGDSPPEVMAEVRAALAAGRPAREIRSRLMLLDLTRQSNGR